MLSRLGKNVCAQNILVINIKYALDGRLGGKRQDYPIREMRDSRINFNYKYFGYNVECVWAVLHCVFSILFLLG